MNRKEILLSIYPNPSIDNNSSIFDIQIVNKQGYYPLELEFLAKKIFNSENTLEMEKTREQFHGFINNRKNELTTAYHKSILREKINQRSIYVLVNSHNEPLYNADQTDLIYLAGPLGGGKMSLDHDLRQTPPQVWLSLLEMNGNVGSEIDEIIVDNTIAKFSIQSTANNPLRVEHFPISIDNINYHLKRAVTHFEDEYQRLSMINDFAPMVDSAMRAGIANFSTSRPYFIKLPPILEEKIDQYSLDKDQVYPSFMGVGKLVRNIISRDISKLNIIGFSLTHKNKEYSLIFENFTDELKIFCIAETPLYSLREFVNNHRNSRDLKWTIQELKGSNQYSMIKDRNKIDIMQDEVLRTTFNLKSLDNNLKQNEKGKMEYEYPIGYFKFDTNGNYSTIRTSFVKNELPSSFAPIIFEFQNAFQFLLSGPLADLSFRSNNLSIYFDTMECKFKIEYFEDPEKSPVILIYLLTTSHEELIDQLKQINRNIDQELEKLVQRPMDEGCYLRIIERLDNQSSREINDFNKTTKTETSFPLVSYTQTILKDRVVPVLMKRILNQVQLWEVNNLGEIDDQFPHQSQGHSKGHISRHQLFNREKTQSKSELLNNYLQKIQENVQRDEKAQSKLEDLENEINNFNPDLFSFLIDMQRREYLGRGTDDSDLYENIKHIFEDMSVALIDFGLLPVQWVNASNLQLWNSYQSQVKFMEHSIKVRLGRLFNDNFTKSELDQILNHPYTKNIQYTSFEGTVTGHRYISLKKFYLSFMPKLDKYEHQISDINSVDALIKLIEKLEYERKERVRAQIPKLPQLKVN